MVNPTDIFAALAGTYTLLNTSSTLNGTAVPDLAYGEAPIGLITYTAAGYMSATLAATEPDLRPANLTFPFQASDPDSLWALVGKHSLAYAGPFRVSDAIPANETHGQIFHGPLVVANVPAWVGSSQRRNYSVIDEGGERYLRIESRRDAGNEGVLWWRKVA
ncbi:unnamed protein product [Periconia digitata]|uniref:Lipocalin-like domain-containing protein n=1 Tax=Periconia digitata TaxID=1303443 RepID=A0A9W4XIS8_9PLEO|nr:unnamed protein product [Periconia digitata]